MSKNEQTERVYTVNLSKVLISPDNRRSKRAVNMIKEFAQRHMKTTSVKIDEELNSRIWLRGIRSPPRKVKVKMTKDEDGNVIVSSYEEKAAKTSETKEKSETTTTASAAPTTAATGTDTAAKAPETTTSNTDSSQTETGDKQKETNGQDNKGNE